MCPSCRLCAEATDEEAAALRAVLAEDKTPEVIRRSMINVSNLKFGKKRLGSGAFGEVWPATLNGTPVAVKKLHRNRIDEDQLRAFRDEFELQLSLRHPNILQVIGGSWSLEDVNVCIVLELCEGGTLEDLLIKDPRSDTLSWTKHKLPIACDVARAMTYLHSQTPPIVHRDLKPDNILINDVFTAKLADFGCSRELDLEKTMETAGSPITWRPSCCERSGTTRRRTSGPSRACSSAQDAEAGVC